jgi:methionyl-tRNA synthetase
MSTIERICNSLTDKHLRRKPDIRNLALAEVTFMLKSISFMVSIKDFQQLDIRIAEVIDARPHPDADRLYLLKIKIGEVEKQIVAGIRSSYTSEQLIGKKIVVVNNLEPAVIRGIKSQGMLLAASDGQGHSVLIPDRDIPSGAQVK